MAQVGLSVVLLAGTGLLIRALIRVQSISPGFNVQNVLTMRTTLPFSKYGMQAPRAELCEGSRMRKLRGPERGRTATSIRF